MNSCFFLFLYGFVYFFKLLFFCCCRLIYVKNDIILIELKINDNVNANTFVFDTGASSNVLDIQVAKSLGLKPNYKQDVRGTGGVNSYDIVLDQKFKLGKGIEIENANLIIVDLRRLNRKLEKKFDGIIGYSLVRNYITKIDYENQKIQLFDEIEDVKTDGYSRIPFQFKRGILIPQFDISITLNNNEQFGGTIFFDSGAARTLSINTPYNKRHKLNKKVDRRLISEIENLNKKSILKDIAIKSMTIGEYTMDEMVISLTNEKEGVSSYHGYLGILGAKVISRFNIILDYSSSTLFLKPNRNFAEAFEFPMSGITLARDNDSIVISRIQQNSMAYQKGVKKGDKLISIDSISTKDIETYRKLLKKEGKICNLVLVDKEGKFKSIDIKLVRLL